MLDFPTPEALKHIVRRYARVLSTTGAELGERPLVLPNGAFFPDPFERDEASAAALAVRMLEHAGMTDVPLAVRVIDEDGPEPPHEGCSSGCAVPAAVSGSVPRLIDDGAGWTLNVPAFELAHPVVLTTMMARALGHVFLVEASPAGATLQAPVDLTADYAAVALGLGPLLLEGAYVYSKGCGGPSVAELTRAHVSELAVLTALFIETGGHSARAALRELSTTQTAALAEAHGWAKSNAALVRLLRTDPERVADGDVRLNAAKPWLLRLFDKKPKSADVVPEAPPPTPRAPSPPDPERDALRALVDEALTSARADAE